MIQWRLCKKVCLVVVGKLLSVMQHRLTARFFYDLLWLNKVDIRRNLEWCIDASAVPVEHWGGQC